MDGRRSRRARATTELLQNIGIGEVVLVASEGPHARAGGISQVIVGLLDSLSASGIPVTLITPLYEQAQGSKHKAAETVLCDGIDLGEEVVVPHYVGQVKIPFGPTYRSAVPARQPSIAVAEVFAAESGHKRILFLRHRLLADRLYADVWADEQLRRAIFLARGALEVLRDPSFEVEPHIVVTNDWHTGLLPVLHRTDTRYGADPRLRKMETLHMLHNCGRDYQGRFALYQWGEDLWPLLGLAGEHRFGLGDPQEPDLLNITAGAITHASKGVVTVSKHYAEQLLSEEGGEGLHDLLRRRADLVFGISNGIDCVRVRALAGLGARSALTTTAKEAGPTGCPEVGKLRIKAEIQKSYGLQVNPEALLLSMVGRLAEQKGISLLSRPVEVDGKPLLEAVLGLDPNIQILVAGPPAVGDPATHALSTALHGLVQRYPGRVVACLEFVRHPEALKIIAASELFLMPSRFEPGGITQLEALALGTPVVARRVGGIAATLVDFRTPNADGCAFLFEEYSSGALFEAIGRAYQVMRNDTERRSVIERAASQNHDWQERVPRYRALFQHAAGLSAIAGSYAQLVEHRALLASITAKVCSYGAGLNGW